MVIAYEYHTDNTKLWIRGCEQPKPAAACIDYVFTCVLLTAVQDTYHIIITRNGVMSSKKEAS